MSMESLAARARLLEQTLATAKQEFIAASEKHEQAKAHLHTVSGHFNEVAFLMAEAKKLAPLVTSQEPIAENDSGQIDDQS